MRENRTSGFTIAHIFVVMATCATLAAMIGLAIQNSAREPPGPLMVMIFLLLCVGSVAVGCWRDHLRGLLIGCLTILPLFIVAIFIMMVPATSWPAMLGATIVGSIVIIGLAIAVRNTWDSSAP